MRSKIFGITLIFLILPQSIFAAFPFRQGILQSIFLRTQQEDEELSKKEIDAYEGKVPANFENKKSDNFIIYYDPRSEVNPIEVLSIAERAREDICMRNPLCKASKNKISIKYYPFTFGKPSSDGGRVQGT